ncbi:MAG: prenyltransferase/squalene oxidase repeat-containing protein [Planctomycetota bacterium]|nr:prenyltransferase/squalene oxidase repeat-containing protein [Planctomycetota bacterium]
MISETLQSTLSNLSANLLNERHKDGYWVGELSSSALSTAVACIALQLKSKKSKPPESVTLKELVNGGMKWLAKTQNDDGGFGDTVLSFSNISTTALCWAALCICDTEKQFSESRTKVEAWMTKAAGDLSPATLQRAIIDRYGKDKTFSVPILMTLALAGRLGEGKSGWKRVPQLPFQFAACPKEWFRWMRLPVVSYAIPALIAIGQVRYKHCPNLNPIGNLARRLTRKRTLTVLSEVQPSNGGFLEATPLTSFVSMSLISCDLEEHPVVKKGVEFLIDSVREDGSWPIDTNLATWVTTLSIKALSQSSDFESQLPETNRQSLRKWLLDQQYRVRHPYTDAPPGGWAWTDLPGGVPDADDTAGALIALTKLGPIDDIAIESASAGIHWLMGLQNGDGGIATFCRGWGKLPFDRSSQDLTAHALLAWSHWQDKLAPALKQRVQKAVTKGLRFLQKQQAPSGSFVPLWFGNQYLEVEENPVYGTGRVLLALNQYRDHTGVTSMIEKAENWLLSVQNPDGGWGGGTGTPSSLEESALALDGLASNPKPSDAMNEAMKKVISWIHSATKNGTKIEASPIGFYFAKLWYFERLYPHSFLVSALGRAQIHVS